MLPTYVNETKFYRRFLGISYEFGSHLRKSGFLRPDAVMDDGRPLFLLGAESLERHQAQISAYRAQVREAKEGVAA